MILEEFPFVCQGFFNGLTSFDITLTTIYDGDVAKTKRDDSTSQDVDYICSLVHQIDFREDADCSTP
jgi:hypothetical protein